MTSLKATSSYTSCSLHDPVKILASEESLAEIKPQTIPEFFHQSCQIFKDLPALAFKREAKDVTDTWTTVTFEDFENNVEQAALALLYLGVPPRSSVSILAFNCPEWFYIQLGALCINAVSAGIYLTNSAEAVFHVLQTSDASVTVVDDSHQLSKVRAIRARLPQLLAVVQLNGPFDFVEEDQKQGYYRWSDLMEMKFSTVLREELRMRAEQVAPNECALLIYTSGTDGMPKGVMLSHDSVLYCAQSISKSLPTINPGRETVISYLPLNHIGGQLFELFLAMVNGATIYFADCNALKGTLGKTLVESRPTILLGVPRIFEKMQEKLMQTEAKSLNMLKCISNMARTTMLQYHLDNIAGKSTSYLKYWLASRITSGFKRALGLDHIKVCFIGGAPVSEELKRFFLSLDVNLLDAYGMSEASGAVVLSLEKPNLRTVGKPLRGIEVKIREPSKNEAGEILLRGRTNFMGYLKDAKKTKETLTEDGWILTGDRGYLDDEGNLYINGRIKELLITAGGENVPPVHIENLIKKELPCISNAVAIGDGRKYITALLTFKTHIDPESGYPLDSLLPESIDWLTALDMHYTHLSEMLHVQLPGNLEDFDPNSVEVKLDDKLQQALEDGIKRANAEAISNAQKVQYFRVLPHDLSISAGELGPTLKIRRHIVHTKYAEIIDKMYKK